MKYIDAEKLKKLIDEKWKELADKNVKVGGGKWDAEIITYLSVLNLIDSLQQEQPEVDLEKLVNEEFASHSRTTEYGLEVTYNRAELYQLIKRMALVFNARREE